MVFKKIYFLHGMIAIVLLTLTGFGNILHGQSLINYWGMEGTLVTHVFIDKTDSLSGPEIFELQDHNGLAIWFGRDINKDVCISGECKMIRLWLFWDGAGNYLGMQIPKQEPFTKSDHNEFETEDYEKLDGILRDTASILKTMKQEDLIIAPDANYPYEVDGITSATQPTLTEVVVKDAVYTCHTLWHTVYGPIQNEIFKVLENKLSKEFLSKMFESCKPEYALWAIKSIEGHPQYHADFYPTIMEFIRSDNSTLAIKAMDYFKPELLVDTSIQLKLVQIMADTDKNNKYEILWKFIAYGNTDEDVVLDLLRMFNDQNIGIGAYNLILRLVKPEHLKENEEIAQIIHHLSEHKNDYVRNLTNKLMDINNTTDSK